VYGDRDGGEEDEDDEDGVTMMRVL
jgi:hypothetical protein